MTGLFRSLMKPMYLGRLLVLAALMLTLQGCAKKEEKTFNFNIVNNSGLTVTEFYLSPSSSASWGANQLSSPISTGSTRGISGVAPCSANFDYYGTNGAGVTWGPSYNVLMPPCGGTYTLTLL